MRLVIIFDINDNICQQIYVKNIWKMLKIFYICQKYLTDVKNIWQMSKLFDRSEIFTISNENNFVTKNWHSTVFDNEKLMFVGNF